MTRYIFIILVCFTLAACGTRTTDVKVKHPSGAEGELHHESDTSKCGKQKNCN